MRANKTSRLFLVTVLSVAVLAIALEVGLRTILGLGSPVLYVTDPRFGYFPKGNQHLHRFFVDIDTNRFGMRSDPVSEVKTVGEYRILFVGDSVPFGTTYVDQRDIFVERIGASLKKIRGKLVSALNASSPGWAPSNEFEFIKARGLYDADLVVLVYNTKDLTQPFSPYQESPLAPLQNPPTAIGELWSRYLKPRIFTQRAVVDPGSTTSAGKPLMADEARVMETIEMTRQFVVSHGARFVILFSPAVTDDVRQYQGDWDQAFAKLKSWANEHQVPLIDLTSVSSSQDSRAFYFDGIHLRPRGDQLVAEAFTSWFAHNY